MKISIKDKYQICVIGLGYVGLPLAYYFSKKFNVIGYDTNSILINELKSNKINLRNYGIRNHKLPKKLQLKSKLKDNTSNIYIVTVPTPIYSNNKPDLRYINQSCRSVAKVIKKNDIVIFESTVYPGLTREFAIPIIEKKSMLKSNKDFFFGYSPERVNPADTKHLFHNTSKIVSGSNKKVTKIIYNLYNSVINAKIHIAKSIEVAEAAKVIENSQRDINIAFMNELSIIFNKLNISTDDVLKVASTKWNFLHFKPGLVGGHCIGIDPYYLTYKSNLHGYKPKIILAGRKLNDNLPYYIYKQLVNKAKVRKVKLSKVLVMGMSFKENIDDFRNSKVIDLINSLRTNKKSVDVYDPLIDKNKINKKKINLIPFPKIRYYDAIIICVAHNFIKNMKIDEIKNFAKKKCLIFDLKNIFGESNSDFQL